MKNNDKWSIWFSYANRTAANMGTILKCWFPKTTYSKISYSSLKCPQKNKSGKWLRENNSKNPGPKVSCHTARKTLCTSKRKSTDSLTNCSKRTFQSSPSAGKSPNTRNSLKNKGEDTMTNFTGLKSNTRKSWAKNKIHLPVTKNSSSSTYHKRNESNFS